MDATTVILVPGAWMGSWIWEPTARALRERGFAAEALTLRGLDRDAPEEVARVGLSDHVDQVVGRVEALGTRPVVLVSHSYSAMVTASAADRLGDRVAGLIHVGGFIPADGRSLLDDWGDSDADRAQERAAIEAAGHRWLAPEADMLRYQTDLTPADRAYLIENFTPHPGRTITDPARLANAPDDQPTTYVATALEGGFEEAWAAASEAAKRSPTWRRRHLASGHWPMLSVPAELVDLLAEEVAHYAAKGR